MGVMLTQGRLVMISFMCQLNWLWGTQINNYFWVYFVREFPGEISIEIGGLSKVDCPRPQCGWTSSSLLRA